MSFTAVLKNSTAVNSIKKMARGSRFLALLASLAGALTRIIAGSRIVSFLKVGDYLDVDSKPLASWLKNAEIYRRTSHLAGACTRRIRSWIENLHLDRSELVSRTAAKGQDRQEILTRRNILFFALAFLAAFYILRSLLIAFIPQGDFRISWSAGLLLTLMLVVILLQLAPANKTSSPEGSGAGVIQNTGKILLRLALSFARSGKSSAKSVSGFIRRRKTGGNNL